MQLPLHFFSDSFDTLHVFSHSLRMCILFGNTTARVFVLRIRAFHVRFQRIVRALSLNCV